MELITIKRSEKDQKEQILELLKNADNRIIIMMSQAWFHDFTNRTDIKQDMYEFNSPDEIVYEIYENEKIVVCRFFGRMKFELIGGLFFLESCDFLNYKSYGDEANEIVFLE